MLNYFIKYKTMILARLFVPHALTVDTLNLSILSAGKYKRSYSSKALRAPLTLSYRGNNESK